MPVSELAGAVRVARDLLADCPIPAAILGHVGDGNFHVVFALDVTDPAEIAAVKAINAGLVAHAIAVGGTCTGEHGVGTGKIGYLADEYDPAALHLMAALKHAVDPKGIMNPGKILA